MCRWCGNDGCESALDREARAGQAAAVLRRLDCPRLALFSLRMDREEIAISSSTYFRPLGSSSPAFVYAGGT